MRLLFVASILLFMGCQSETSTYHYLWKARQFDKGYYVTFTYHDSPSKWRDQTWPSIVRERVVAKTLSDFEKRGITLDAVFLSAGLQQGGGVGVGMLLGDRNFCLKWERVEREQRAGLIMQGEREPWILSGEGDFNMNSANQ